jgi:hypothetical protein
MTVETYIRRKNEIVKEATDKTLVPEEQIEDIPDFKYLLSIDNDSEACPYCAVYINLESNCTECPMAKVGNNCIVGDSTYIDITGDSNYSIVNNKAIRPKLKKLIEEFNDGR